MNILQAIEKTIQDNLSTTIIDYKRFFKDENMKFLNIKTEKLRQIAKQYKDIEWSDLTLLIQSEYNQKRLLALLILMLKYKKQYHEGYVWYMQNIQYIDNWNLVDTAAYYVIGHYSDLIQNQQIVLDLVNNENVWIRRIGLISTMHYIRKQQFTLMLECVEKIKDDKRDMIKKSRVWLIKEYHKRIMKK